MIDNVRAQVFTNNIEGPRKNDETSSSFRLQSSDDKIGYNLKSDDVREVTTTEYTVSGIDIYKPFDENERYD